MLRNLLKEFPPSLAASLPAELTEVIIERSAIRIERIVSTGHATAAGSWYDQDEDEWVLVLQGKATLRIEGELKIRQLNPGDHVHLPAHCRHRVEWTTPSEPTIWLAVFFKA